MLYSTLNNYYKPFWYGLYLKFNNIEYSSLPGV